MIRTSMGQLLINEALPPEMRNYDRVLDKKGMNAMLRELAQKHPEKYAEVSKKLSDVGRTVATEFGGYSFGLEHLKKSAVAKKQNAELKIKVKRILDMDQVKIGGKMVDVTPQMRKDMIVKTVGGYQQKQIDDIYNEAVKGNNPLALQVVSGSRGNKMNLASLLGSDMLYADHRNETIPLGVTSSYSQGLKPVEYWAATYGARRGTMATKFATQDAGFLSKQLNQVAHRLMIVGDDDDRDDVMPHRGLPVDTDDGDNEGALLARDVGPYKRNTILSPKILKHLKGLGHDRLLVRSPLVGGSPDGGVYARDVGVRERGTLPGRGEQVGLTAAQALSEPLAQGQLSAKHSGGVAGQEKAVGGFAYINQLIQVPKKGKGWAAHAEHDGTVSSVEPAPAGGNYVWVGDKRHYVPSNVELKVKKGDPIEAGDVLSEGFPNPSVVTQHKGVGEGKRYFVNAFRSAMNDAGMKCNRRNVELLARGLINHVRLTDEMGDHVPDDVVPYSTIEHVYQPREDHEVMPSARALGQYLERPVLHYSIGTKVRPSVLKELQHFGVSEVAVHKEPPPFQSEMIRGMYNLQHDPDWMTRMYGSGLKDSLTDATHHGAVSDELGTSFVPGLSRAVEFGRKGAVRQPEKGTTPPPEGQPLGDPRRAPEPPKPVSPAITMPAAPPGGAAEKKPKKTGFFSGMFKMSEEEIIKEAAVRLARPVHAVRQAVQAKQTTGKAKQIARMRLTKQAAEPTKPTVDSTTKPTTGSSTAGPGTTTTPVTPGAPPAPNPSIMPAGPAPVPGGVPNPNIMPGGTPAATTTPNPGGAPSPPGVVNPARVPQNAWAGGVATPDPNASRGQNPDAFREGYTPGEGIMNPGDDPGMAAEFVQGGGHADDPSSGYGGQFGAVTRFGSLLDNRAVAALTGRGQYVHNETGHGGYHDNLIGGVPQAQGGQPDWLNTLMRDRSKVAPDAAPPATTQPVPPPEPAPPAGRPPILDVLGAFVGPEAAAIAAGGSVAYRTARSVVRKPVAGGIFGGLFKPLSKVTTPLAVGLEAYDAVNMTGEEGVKRLDDKMSGKGDTHLPFGLGTVKGDTFGGYMFNNAMEPGKNLRAGYSGLVRGLGDLNQAGRDATKLDASEAAMLTARVADPRTAPADKAKAEQRLAAIRSANGPSTSDAIGKALLGGNTVTSDQRFAQAQYIREQELKKIEADRVSASQRAAAAPQAATLFAKIRAGGPLTPDEQTLLADAVRGYPADGAATAVGDDRNPAGALHKLIHKSDDPVVQAAVAKAATRNATPIAPAGFSDEISAWETEAGKLEGSPVVEHVRARRDAIMARAATETDPVRLGQMRVELSRMGKYLTGRKTQTGYDPPVHVQPAYATGQFNPDALRKEFDAALSTFDGKYGHMQKGGTDLHDAAAGLADLASAAAMSGVTRNRAV